MSLPDGFSGIPTSYSHQTAAKIKEMFAFAFAFVQFKLTLNLCSFTSCPAGPGGTWMRTRSRWGRNRSDTWSCTSGAPGNPSASGWRSVWRRSALILNPTTHKKAFHLNTNRPLANLTCCIVWMYGGGGRKVRSKLNKFKDSCGQGPVQRTDRRGCGPAAPGSTVLNSNVTLTSNGRLYHSTLYHSFNC